MEPFRAKAIRALRTVEGLEEILSADVVHHMEDGEVARTDLRIVVKNSHDPSIEGTKTAIVWLGQRVVSACRPRFLSEHRSRLPFAGAARLAAQKIELVFSCQSQNLSTEASGACALAPVGLTAKPDRPRAEN
jgi:hypothetical protein